MSDTHCGRHEWRSGQAACPYCVIDMLRAENKVMRGERAEVTAAVREAGALRRLADAAIASRLAGYAEPYSWVEDERAGLELISATDELIESRAKAEGTT